MRRLFSGIAILVSGAASLSAQPVDPAGTASNAVENATVSQLPAVSEFVRFGQYSEALAILNQEDAGGLRPEEAKVYRGIIAWRQGQIQAAEGYFRDAIAMNPGYDSGHFNLGELAYSRRDFEEALNAYRAVIAIDETNPVAQLKGLLCLIQLDRQSDADEWMKTIHYSSKNPLFYYAHAVRHFQRGETDAGMYFVVAARQLFARSDNQIFLTFLLEQGWITPAEMNREI